MPEEGGLEFGPFGNDEYFLHPGVLENELKEDFSYLQNENEEGKMKRKG